MPYFYGIDIYYIVLVLPALFFSLWAQGKVKSAFAKYSKITAERNVTAADAARGILDSNGLYNIKIERTPGSLSDHYDPRAGVIRLSDSVYSSSSIAAVGVAAHEAGHAVQHSVGYTPIKIRNGIFPAVSFASRLAVPLAILGFIFSYSPLVKIGIVLFALTVLFQLITLPVEFDASKRALRALEGYGYLNRNELDGTKKVLTAAALTYVGAALTAVMSLLRLILLANNRNRR